MAGGRCAGLAVATPATPAMAANSTPAASQCRRVLAVAVRARREAGMAVRGAAQVGQAARQALASRFRDNTGFRAPATALARAVPSLCFHPVFHASRAAPAEPCCRAPLVPDMLCRAARAGPVRLFAAL
ncbi:exported hypothetical protein [Cupriavidus taiwanensis]|nr:exported hypothetical protein [Cupriavidus taiwanensis]SOZ26801.1 exported hypothetical protein [Cupriavidus taiwanensis]